MLTVTDIILAVVLLFVCGYAAVSDIRTGKIKNSVLLAAGALSLIAVAVKLLIFDQSDGVLILQNAGITALIGLAGYLFRIWAGGDCKVLAVIALAFPSLCYFDYNGIRLTLWMIPAAAFCISFLYVLTDSVVMSVRKRSGFHSKRFFGNLKRYLLLYLKSLVYLTALNQLYLILIAEHFFVYPAVYFAVSVLLVFVIGRIRLLGNVWVVMAVAAVDVALLLVFRHAAFLFYWKNYLLIFVFMLLKAFMSLYNYQNVNTAEVTAGMILSAADTAYMQQSRVKGLPALSDETLKSRLTAEEAESVRRWGRSKYGRPQLAAVRKMPFTAFLSISAVIYFLAGVLQLCDFS